MNNDTKENDLAYLTSRLRVYFLTPNPKNLCLISLDRITITGTFHAEQHFNDLIKNGWNELSEIDGHPIKYELCSHAVKDKKQRIAVLIRNDYQRSSWRMDTSNHLTKRQKERIANITKLFENPHTSRIDIAFDFINWKQAGMSHRLYNTNMSQTTFSNRLGNVETIYYGKSSSKKQYRYYDKKKEQASNNSEIMDKIKNWERLELVLRQSNTNNWQKEAEKMLECFKRPTSTNLEDKNIHDFLILEELKKHPNYIGRFSKKTRAKYRKMLSKNIGFDDSESKEALIVLKKEEMRIQQEINQYLK